MIGKREEGVHTEQSKKPVRVSSSYHVDLFEKLDRLATACGLPATTLQTQLVELCLNNESIINFVQDKNQKKARFRIIPSRLDCGELRFVFAEKKADKKRA